jgi:hypothetical protein
LPPILKELALDVQDQADSAISRAASGRGIDPETVAAETASRRARRNAQVIALLLAMIDDE